MSLETIAAVAKDLADFFAGYKKHRRAQFMTEVEDLSKDIEQIHVDTLKTLEECLQSLDAGLPTRTICEKLRVRQIPYEGSRCLMYSAFLRPGRSDYMKLEGQYFAFRAALGMYLVTGRWFDRELQGFDVSLYDALIRKLEVAKEDRQSRIETRDLVKRMMKEVRERWKVLCGEFAAAKKKR
jgi:hypothetical protein